MHGKPYNSVEEMLEDVHKLFWNGNTVSLQAFACQQNDNA